MTVRSRKSAKKLPGEMAVALINSVIVRSVPLSPTLSLKGRGGKCCAQTDLAAMQTLLRLHTVWIASRCSQ
jgi:hypothetical protein